MNKKSISELITNYINYKITDDLKYEFINAAVHFIINEENCNKYDIMKMKYRLKKVKDKVILDYIKEASVLGYIFYRSLSLDLIKEEDKDKCCEGFIEISNEMTKFITMENNEKDLYLGIQDVIHKIGIELEVEEIIINKFSDVQIYI